MRPWHVSGRGRLFNRHATPRMVACLGRGTKHPCRGKTAMACSREKIPGNPPRKRSRARRRPLVGTAQGELRMARGVQVPSPLGRIHHRRQHPYDGLPSPSKRASRRLPLGGDASSRSSTNRPPWKAVVRKMVADHRNRVVQRGAAPPRERLRLVFLFADVDGTLFSERAMAFSPAATFEHI